jgi:hypothetical protein
MTKAELFNVVLVHTARTWERIRLTQRHQEMLHDNIESVDSIIEIAEKVLEDDILNQFLKSRGNWDWEEKTSEGFSDTYIEGLAEKIIKGNYK